MQDSPNQDPNSRCKYGSDLEQLGEKHSVGRWRRLRPWFYGAVDWPKYKGFRWLPQSRPILCEFTRCGSISTIQTVKTQMGFTEIEESRSIRSAIHAISRLWFSCNTEKESEPRPDAYWDGCGSTSWPTTSLRCRSATWRLDISYIIQGPGTCLGNLSCSEIQIWSGNSLTYGFMNGIW